MSISLAEAFDIAITRQQMGESLADILADFPQYADKLRSLLQTTASLDALKAVEMPSAETMAADRAQFAKFVQNSTTQVVSIGLMERINRWMRRQFPNQRTAPSLITKEKRPIFASLLIKATLIITLVFGSVGGTMVAAAQSLPDSLLYPVKIGLEQARLSLANNPKTEAILHLEMAQERVDEMVRLAEKGSPIDETVVERMQLHLDEALALAGQTSFEAQQGILTRAQEMLQTQERNLSQVQAQNKPQKILEKAQLTLEQTQAQVQSAMQNGIDKGEEGQEIVPNSPIATPTSKPFDPTETPEPHTPTMTPPGVETETPEIDPTETPEHHTPTMTPSGVDTETPETEPTETPEIEYTETPEHDTPTMTPPEVETETPEPEPTATPKIDPTATPEQYLPTMTPPGEPTEIPEPEPPETPEPDEISTVFGF